VNLPAGTSLGKWIQWNFWIGASLLGVHFRSSGVVSAVIALSGSKLSRFITG
jgi:hypothetical protein